MVRKKKTTLAQKRKKVYEQTGKTTTKRDKLLKAKKPGWRKSKSGRWYKETRRNRSDKGKML